MQLKIDAVVRIATICSVSDAQPPKRPKARGSNFEANRRPDTSKRVTFALGTRAQEQADRLARILSAHKKGGVSQSALIRALLEIAESAAIQGGDPVAGWMAGTSPEQDPDPRGSKRKEAVKDPFTARLWERIRSQILSS